MKLHVLGSGSTGNGYILEGENSALIIEAGLPMMEAKKALQFNLSKVAGLVASHPHADHSGRALEYAMAGINIHSSLECLDVIGLTKGLYSHRAKPVIPERKYRIGEFTVMPFDLVHDVTNYGYLISHADMGLTCFITDTHYCPYVFPGLNNLLLECNYSDDVIERRVEDGHLHPSLAERIKNSHMAQSTTLEFLRCNNLNNVNNIVLIHLSQGNSNQAAISQDVFNLTGKTPTIAAAGLTIDFNKQPF